MTNAPRLAAPIEARRSYLVGTILPAWQAELESGRHKQGFHHLRNVTTMIDPATGGPVCTRCCLDVLSELVHDLPAVRETGWTYNREHGFWRSPDHGTNAYADPDEYETLPIEVGMAIGMDQFQINAFTELNDGIETEWRSHTSEHGADVTWEGRIDFAHIAIAAPFVLDGTIKPE